EGHRRPSGHETARAPCERVGLVLPGFELDEARIAADRALEHGTHIEPGVDVDRHVLLGAVVLRGRGLSRRDERNRSRREQNDGDIQGMHPDRDSWVSMAQLRRCSALSCGDPEDVDPCNAWFVTRSCEGAESERRGCYPMMFSGGFRAPGMSGA